MLWRTQVGVARLVSLLSIALAALAATTVPALEAQAVQSHPHAFAHVNGAQGVAEKKDTCKAKKLKEVEKTKNAKYCTHGPDPVPPGLDISTPVPPLTAIGATPEATPLTECNGDGTSGARVQVIYAHASDVPNRYNIYVASFRQWVTLADRIYQESAAETGGRRHIRFVHDSGCNPIIPNITLSPTGDDTFGDTINELQAQGYNRTDRKYMVFVDATVYCGIGGIWGDDQASASNLNNFGPSYGRTDSGCWSGNVLAHELMHNLGGVQLSAPNTSGGYHCIDEYDVECYSDTPYFPVMQFLCTDAVRDTTRLDCNHDDYYHTNPIAGSYLATHWNTASNQFLDGGLAPPPCPDAGYEPDNSAGEAQGFAIDGTQKHAFCISSDQDWIFFQGTAGQSYRIETFNLTPMTDTILDLYASDGSTLIASNDDSGGTWASLILFTPTTSGKYYLRATQFGGTGSTGFQYDLHITTDVPPNPVPTTNSLNPTSAARGGPAFTLTVNGTNFVTTSIVRWNGANRTTTFMNSTQLTAAIPASDIATAGTAGVTIFTPAPGGGTSNAQTFTITAPDDNRLRNASFDDDTNPSDGKPDVWGTNNKFTRSTGDTGVTPRAGSAMGRFSATDNSGSNTNQVVSALTAGTTYTISCWVNIPPQNDTTAFTFKIQVKWRNASNSALRTDTIKSYSAVTNGWNQATKSPAPVAPTGTTNAQVILTAGSLNGKIFVDDCLFR